MNISQNKPEPQTKTNMLSKRKIVSYIILAAIIAFLIYYLKDHPQIIQQLKKVSPEDFFVLSVITLIIMITNGIRAKILTEIFTGKKLLIREWLGLSTINTLGNYSPFQGGFVARAYYLKSYFHVPYSHFTSSIVASTILTFSTYSFLSALVIIIGSITGGAFYLMPFLVFLFIGIVGLTTILLLPKLKNLSFPDNLVGHNALAFIDGWKIISSSNHCLIKLVLLDIASLVIFSTRYYYAASIIEVNINYIQSMVISSMATVALIVNITPGAIGIRETIAGFTAKLMGADLASAILVAGLERALILFWVIAFGIPFSIYFARYLNKNK